MTTRPDLTDLSVDELIEFLDTMGEKPFRARQIQKWLYKSGVTTFEEMTDLSRDLRARLADLSEIGQLKQIHSVESEDGSRKYLWELKDGNRVESVLLPERGHYTLCVSSQVGCAMGCRFCRTAGLGLKRNLTQGEIAGQVLAVRRALATEENLTNLVFMGMGEPLANRTNVVRALNILTEPGLGGLSRRHLSLSTVGLVPEIAPLADDITIGLTVSLNAADDKIRDYLMPINCKYPLEKLHRALAIFPLPSRRRITIAYVMLAGVNDSQEQALQLSRYLHGLKVKVNLIPFNPWPGSEFETPTDEQIMVFQEILTAKNYTAIIRKSKGRDVSAACGQLAAQDGST
jgi:23S rRNA (adenine2503-C2)-methyltransferase